MRRGTAIFLLVLIALVLAGCESMPGLQVLLGRDPQTTGGTNQAVTALDLVMADKTGTTDPSLFAAADRIEAASSRNVDIIEIRKDDDNRLFTVNMLYRPPNTENTQQGQIERDEAVRRAIELTWQGTMRDSEGADQIRVTLLAPGIVNTLDNGQSFVGLVMASSEIERGAAAAYLAGTRSLVTFTDLIAQGQLSYEVPQEQILYDGEPNHPMVMLSTTGG